MAQTPTRTERKILGGAVKQIRRLQGKTQADVATLAGVSADGKPMSFTTVAHIEKNRGCSLDVMCRIANALGVALDDITYVANVYVVAEDAA
jgi:transcriptional regulator with XRE-family HTH domain